MNGTATWAQWAPMRWTEARWVEARWAPVLRVGARWVGALALAAVLGLGAGCGQTDPPPSPASPGAPTAEPAAPPVRADTDPILTLDPGGHMALITDLMFSPDGRELYSVSNDKTIRVWDPATGRPLRTLRGQIGAGHEGKLFAGALAPDGGRLAVGGYVGAFSGTLPRAEEGAHKIRLLDPRTGRVESILRGHENVVLALAFSPDGRLLASGSGDRTARIWEAASGRSLHTLSGHTDFIHAVAFSPDGERLATGSDDHSLRLWSVRDGRLLAVLEGHADDVVSAAFTPDGRHLLSGSDDRSIRLWDGHSGDLIRELARQDSGVDSLSVSPDGRWVVTGIGQGPGTTIHRFAIPSGEALGRFTAHDNLVLATAVSPDGRLVSSGGGNDNEIQLWDPADGRIRHSLRGQGQPVWAVGFARDGAGIGWGKTLGREDPINSRGPLEQSFLLRLHGAPGLAWGEALNWFQAWGYRKGIAKANGWSLRTSGKDPYGSNYPPTLELVEQGEVRHRITRDATNGFDHRALTLIPDARLAVSGGANGVLQVYDTRSGALRFELKGHTSDILALAPSPDGRLLVSGSTDQTVRLWSLEDGLLLLTIFAGRDGDWVAWTPEGFFEASPNGARMIGYHLNRGEDQAADYVVVDQLYDLFHRPDLVALAATPEYPAKARAALAAIGSIDRVLAGGLPPELQWAGPAAVDPRTGEVRVRLKIKPRDGGLGRIDYRVDGVLKERVEARAANLGRVIDEPLERIFSLAPGEHELTATAWNERGEVESRPIALQVRVPERAGSGRGAGPRLHVLTAGVSLYRDRDLGAALRRGGRPRRGRGA